MFALSARADYSVLHTMENECCYWGNVWAKNDRGHDHPLLISYCIRNLSLSSQRWKKKSEKMEKQKETNCITPHSHHRKSRESTNMELMREFLKTEFISSFMKHVQSHLTLCNPMDCSPPGSSIHSISQARLLKWVAISFSRGSFRPRDWTHGSCISCIGRGILYHWATWEGLVPKPIRFLVVNLTKHVGDLLKQSETS